VAGELTARFKITHSTIIQIEIDPHLASAPAPDEAV
jgi:hypothetical protein